MGICMDLSFFPKITSYYSVCDGFSEERCLCNPELLRCYGDSDLGGGIQTKIRREPWEQILCRSHSCEAYSIIICTLE